MAAINQTKITCPTEGNRPLGGTAALRTGLFQSIDNLDPDIVRQPKITSSAPSLWNKIFGSATDR
ncbi:hypothetical protein [Glutamicibacter sp. TV12E]|uniref:hypothetical protein n=1 Tax=Glutamicibacter sp. TV12E TaxID=3446362 RepID=UPI0040331B27